MHLFHTRFQTAAVSICKIAQSSTLRMLSLSFPRFGAPLVLREAGLCVGNSLCPPRVAGTHTEPGKARNPTGRESRAPRRAARVALAGAAGPGLASGRRGHAPVAGEHAPENHPPRSHTRPGGPAAGSWGSRSLSFWKLTARLPGFAATTTITGAQMVVL